MSPGGVVNTIIPAAVVDIALSGYVIQSGRAYMAKAHEIGTSRVEKIDISHFSPCSI